MDGDRARLMRRRLVAALGVAALFVASGVVAVALDRRSVDTTPFALSGDIAVHDPAIVAGSGGSPWFLFSTGSAGFGGNVQVRTSPDGHDWTAAGSVFTDKPGWIAKAVPGVAELWAPDVHRHGNTWYLYYAASTFGSNRSVIGLATNSTLDPAARGYHWVDRGPILASTTRDDFNAIDPNVVDDASGRPWMVFGSFWSGIRMVRLEYPSGGRADRAAPLRLANRGTAEDAVEAPSIVPHDGWYYLFVSFDHCCRGVASTYNIDVGRSRSVAGPYLDRRGRDLEAGGGSLVLRTSGRFIGPGGQSYSNGFLAYHYYDGENGGAFALAIRRVDWTAAGWPIE
jgi:arabinan endo-1,5-alpha-L-arabinosidase